jgi:glycerate 2-kinase
VADTERKLRRDALDIAKAALSSADAGSAVRRHLQVIRLTLRVGSLSLPLQNFERVFLLAVGKAAGSMADAVVEILGERLTAGLLITKQGHATSRSGQIRSIESAHPVPDNAGLEASVLVHELLQQLNARDLLLVAVSGGASALLPAPAAGLTLSDKQTTTDLLLQSGAHIGELNAVRKHLSSLKGGRLAAWAHPATVVGLLLSDVLGDDTAVIGSGLTSPDPTTFGDAIEILERYRLMSRVPAPVKRHLLAGRGGKIPETPKPGDPLFSAVHTTVVGSNRQALEAAARQARSLGYRTAILTSTLSGEAREAAVVHASILREIRNHSSPVSPPACLLSGGETTVTIQGHGKGGRNQEFALAAAAALAATPDVLVLSLGTDGTDGPTDAAGAYATGKTLARAAALHLDARRYLADNNSYVFFDALGDLIRTGPTGTNVMDVQLLLAL